MQKRIMVSNLIKMVKYVKEEDLEEMLLNQVINLLNGKEIKVNRHLNQKDHHHYVH